MFEMIGMSNLGFRYKKLFGTGSKPEAPKPMAPVPTPVGLDDEVKQRDQDKRRQRIAAAGRGGTILTAGQGLAQGGSATLLGRSNA